jgi:hypothetical protein
MALMWINPFDRVRVGTIKDGTVEFSRRQFLRRIGPALSQRG